MIQDHHALVTLCVEEKLRNTDMVSMFTTVEYVGPSNKILLYTEYDINPTSIQM